MGRAKRTALRLRRRTPIVLLGALLLASLTVSGFTIKLLQGQRMVLEEAIRESQAQAMALLANRVEQALLTAMRMPFLTLKNIPLAEVDEARLHWVQESFPEVERILFLSPYQDVRHSFPKPKDDQQRLSNAWLAQRIALEGAEKQAKSFGLHTFIETLDGRTALFALQPANDISEAEGWLLIRFDLDVLRERHLSPLLREFSHNEGGRVQLQDPEAAWDENALNWPLGRVLPGWMLVFKADLKATDQHLRRQGNLLLAVAGGVLLALAMATFSVWREIRREHALMDLRNRFVANVSHELKTPLALIRMYAETLYLKRVKDGERQHEYHRTILREAERLTQMIDAVLDFARLNQGVSVYQLTEMDLYSTVAEVLERYAPRLQEQNVRLDVALQHPLPPVAHDRNGVTQILLNLIDNAVKYGAAGGVVQVRLAGDGDWVDLTVTDFGPGIPEQERANLRKAFHRGIGSDQVDGSGLGLALVEQVAAAHHAHFILDTPEGGRGVEAVVSFPTYKVPT